MPKLKHLLLVFMCLLRADVGVNAQGGLPVPNLRVEVDGADVTLRWDFPYIQLRVEAGSASGLADLGAFDVTDFPAIDLTHTFGGVPAGTYYVRLRGLLHGQISGPSNEVIATVAGCSAPPQIEEFSGRVLGDTVSLLWKGPGPSCGPTTYLLEAGSTPGASNVGVFDIGAASGQGRQRAWFAAPAPPGHYFARLRGLRGGVVGPATSDVELSVSCLPPKSVFDFRADVTGSTVVFSWRTDNAPVSAHAVVLEVGSGPGRADLAAIPLPDSLGGSPYFSYRASGPPGTYYTRIRTTSPCGSKVTSEIAVTLSGGCMVPGYIPEIDGFLADYWRRLQFFWSPPTTGGPVDSFTVEIGSAPGLSDLGMQTVNGSTTSMTLEEFTAPRAFVRVRPRNACGDGPISFEALMVGGSCTNPPRPSMLPPSVSGQTVTISWVSWTEGGNTPYPTFVEIGTTLYGREVLVSPVYPVQAGIVSRQVTLPPGRYFARGRSVAECGQVGNPSREMEIVVGGGDPPDRK